MESISISGLGGRFPESSNVEEFWEKLLSGQDLVTEDDRRWKPGLWGLPKRNGKLKHVDKFDASFFGVHPKQANNMDPQLRLLLEVSFEAILDAGLSLKSLAGSRTGVWIGVSGSEVREVLSSDPDETEGYGMTGCQTSMFANRLSYFYDLKGPSMSVDTACSSSLLALQMACQSIREGQCDAAIVGGANLIFKPQNSLQFQRLNMLSPDGACKSFDASGNGYVRSEAVSAIFVCKKGMTSRSYCDIVHAKTNSDGRKKEGITFPSGLQQSVLLRETYRECGVNPKHVDYVEAHGTGTKAGDPQELGAIDEVMCEGRETHLLIGSVKSNMGHSEPASGLCAVVKCALALKSRTLPPNLHFQEPNPNITGLSEGRLKVVTDKTALPDNSLIGINSFGFGGSNVHVIVRSSRDEHREDPNQGAEKLPSLRLVTSRTEPGIEEKTRRAGHVIPSAPWDIPPALHPYRGYVIEGDEGALVSDTRKVGNQTEVWFVCSGMGSQWKGMGCDLLKLPIFAKSIERCSEALRCYNMNIRHILINADDVTYDDPIHAFVGLAAVQVGLIDVLKSVGVNPSGIIGHSVGELACSYADGCLTLGQTIKAAYIRGKCIKEAELPNGAMAAVGLTWEECLEQCPPGVAPACHNSGDSVTISGVEDGVVEFVTSLKGRKVFAKLVNTGRIAFHSQFMKRVYPKFIEELRKIIPNPKARSPKWISTSASKNLAESTEEWLSCFQNCSAEYHANNLCNPVMFHEAVQQIPDEAIVIEVAPHSLMQAILKRSLPQGCVRVVLTDRKASDGVMTLYKALGALHNCGVSLDLHVLAGSMPPARDLFASRVDWDHEDTWFVPKVDDFMKGSGDGQFLCDTIKIDINDPKHSYLLGHVVGGRALVPATGYLIFAWQALAKKLQLSVDDLPVQFEDVSILKATMLPESGQIELKVQLVNGTNEFRITDNGKLVASGKIRLLPGEGAVERCEELVENGEKLLTRNEVYRTLRLAGYHYKGEFQAIKEAHQSGRQATIEFNGNYITFLDALLQTKILETDRHTLKLPTRIRLVKLRPLADGAKADVPTKIDRSLDTILASGHVEINGLHLTSVANRDQTGPLLQTQIFVPNFQQDLSKRDESVRRYRQVTWSFLTCNLESLRRKLSRDLQLKNGMEVGTSNDVTKFLTENPQASLLKLVKDFVERDDDLDTTVNSILPLLNSDPLLSYCTANSEVLTTVVDVVLENTGDRLNIAEMGNEILGVRQDLAKTVGSHLDLVPNVEADYVTIGKPNYENATDVTVDWSPLSGTPPPSRLNDVDLFILNEPFCKGTDHAKQLLRSVNSMLRTGFLLFHQQTSQTAFHRVRDEILTNLDASYKFHYADVKQIGDCLSEVGFRVLLRKTDDELGSSLFLCRKETKAVDREIELYDVRQGDFGWVENLQKSLNQSKKQIWLKNDRNASGLVGMVNCLRKEPNGKNIRCIYNGALEPNQLLPNNLDDVISRDLAFNVFRDGQWGTFRHVTAAKAKKVTTPRGYVSAMTLGDLSSLQWIKAPSARVQENQREYEVAFAALNFRDIMLASGKLPSDAIPGDSHRFSTLLGLEFSGRDEKGERIMGMVPAEGLATHVITEPRFTWKVPESWSLSEAATIPVAYSTAYYALLVRAKLRKGESVLIHGGAGGVGQAAISIALHLGCRVFTTVSTRRKRAYLMARFPQLGESNFANSRDLSFERHVMKLTNGRGVDVVLNSLAEEQLEAGLRCVAKHGRFLEIGKFDLSQNSKLGMSIFLRNISFHGILLDSLFDDDTRDWQETKDHVTEGLRTGVVRPLDTTIYNRNDIESAFRFMAQGKHIGKVLINVEEDTDRLEAFPRTSFEPDLTYIVTGGLGGFGLELCNWMVDRGARSIVVTSRSGVKTAYQQQYLAMWRGRGVDVVVSQNDVGSEEATRRLLSDKVGGIFHLAMVLRDSLFANQTEETFREVCRPKCDGTANLDRVSREVCGRLRWFVVFSSVVSGRGNAGQTNYGFANSYMERVCEERRKRGFPGLAVQWGAIGDVGVAVETLGSDVIGGTRLQPMASCLNILDQFLTQDSDVIVSSIVPAPKKKAKRSEESGASVVEAVANIIGIKDITKLDKDATFSSLGLDSLMAIEIAQKLEMDLCVVLTTDEVHQLTLAKLDSLSSGKTVQEKASRTADEILQRMEIHCLKDVVTEPVKPLNQISPCGKENSIIFLHPIEGSSSIYVNVIQTITSPALGVSCSSGAPLDSIESLASFYLEALPPQSRYFLVGYSFGACLAAEMALQLQSRGSCDVDIVLIDGSPKMVSDRVTAYKNLHENMHDNEVDIMTSFLQSVCPNADMQRWRKAFSGAVEWTAKIDRLAEFLKEDFETIKWEVVKQSVEFYQRCLLAALKYKPAGKITAKTTLIKQAQLSTGDYGLDELCCREVDVVEIDADHAGMVKGDNAKVVADVIQSVYNKTRS